MHRGLLRFNIADLSVAINADRHYLIADAYRDFYDSVEYNNTDFHIDMSGSDYSPLWQRGARGDFGNTNNIKCLFDSKGVWKLYKDKTNRYIVVAGNNELIIDKQLSHGELYAKTLRITGRNSLPFSYPIDELLIINLLPLFNGILVHSCGIDDNGRGFLFLGTSGAGKSTTARLWLNHTNPSSPPFNSPLGKGGHRGVKGGQGGILKGVKVLSDDRIIIRKMDEKFYAYGTPWHGEVNICDPGRVEIERILFLEHSEKNYVRPLSMVDAAARMFVRCFPTFWDKEGMAFTLGFIDEVVKKIPCYELGFVPDRSAVEFVRGL